MSPDPIPGTDLVSLADQIELRLSKQSDSGVLFDIGKKLAGLLESSDLDEVVSFLGPLADFSSKKETADIFRLIIDWIRRTQSFVRKKWGGTSFHYQKFKTGNEKLLAKFSKRTASPNEISVAFAVQASELRELVETKPPSNWKKAVIFIPDLIRITLLVLRR